MLIHAVGDTLSRTRTGTIYDDILEAGRMLLMFSTPTFVILSAAVVGYAYDRPPPGFLRKRGRYVLVPFLTMGLVYAVFYPLMYVGQFSGPEVFLAEVVRLAGSNLIGGNHLWFIIPIFQFYLLYAVCGRWLTTAPPLLLLPTCFVINGLYLGIVDFGWLGEAARPQDRNVWSLWFPAWIFYFVYGHRVGRNLLSARSLWSRRLLPFGGLAATAAALMLHLHFSGAVTDVTSRRVDVLLYTVTAAPVLLGLAVRLGTRGRWLEVVSQFSFGIYILHPMFVLLGRRTLRLVPYVPSALEWLALWGFAVLGALGLTFLLGRVEFGSWFVGRSARPFGPPDSLLPSPPLEASAVAVRGELPRGRAH